MTESLLISKLESIDRKLSRLLDQQAVTKKNWVKVGVVTKITGWDHEKMRQARDQGLIKFKKDNGKFMYDLESIPKMFIRNN